jgi:hypothetical protein
MGDRRVDAAIARFDELAARYDGRTPAAIAARRRTIGRDAASLGKRIATIAIALTLLVLGFFAYGLLIAPLGWTGLFALILTSLLVTAFFGIWPRTEARRPAFDEQLPTRAVVRQLDSYLVRQRAALPAPATQKLDAISAQLPLLESRLESVDLLDPLAQDARRLMGKHLPELIDRYERIPAAYRKERDGEGLTVDERLAAGLQAANEALSDIGAKLAKEDLSAFETQGRFIESRYKDEETFKGS